MCRHGARRHPGCGVAAQPVATCVRRQARLRRRSLVPPHSPGAWAAAGAYPRRWSRIFWITGRCRMAVVVFSLPRSRLSLEAVPGRSVQRRPIDARLGPVRIGSGRPQAVWGSENLESCAAARTGARQVFSVPGFQSRTPKPPCASGPARGRGARFRCLCGAQMSSAAGLPPCRAACIRTMRGEDAGRCHPRLTLHADAAKLAACQRPMQFC